MAAYALTHGGGRADPPRRPVLFVNPRSGGGTAARTGLAERARELGITMSLFGPEQSLQALVEEALAHGADTLGVAGGDGSLAIVAAAALRHELPFVCVPAGTRNHFARDLGLDPHDPVGSLAAFTDGVERRIDVGAVNGRLFLNNVSLGVYGEAVRRSDYRDAKVRVLVQTARELLRGSGVAPELHLVDDAGRPHTRPAIVLVSNNPYALDRPAERRMRPTLESGRLGIIVLDEPAGRPLSGRAWEATRLDVRSSAVVHAGIDGESVDLAPPLELEIVPAALRVRVPAADGSTTR